MIQSMENSKIGLKVNNFRAIESADIFIDGITVVAGVNSSGKSTLSKVLYYMYKTVVNYEDLVSEKLRDNISPVERFLRILIHEMRHLTSNDKTVFPVNDYQERLNKLLQETRFSPFGIQIQDAWLVLIHQLKEIYQSIDSSKKRLDLAVLSRLNRMSEEIFEYSSSKKINSDNIDFSKIQHSVNSAFLQAIHDLSERPSSHVFEEFEIHFDQDFSDTGIKLFEFGSEFLSPKSQSIPIPYLVQKPIYIDTPVMLGQLDTEYDYWENLTNLLHENMPLGKSKKIINSLNSIINKEIIYGEASFHEEQIISEFAYTRSDNEVFNLLECATGIKSFSIIQLLLKNGHLTDKTLLIIDEPESHLHPQWIIEYARLIVLLNKEIGVKFFIASHNPDMVSAIKYISEKEQTSHNLNYYLAEKGSTPFSFKYKHLAQDIEPIFKSFNVAIERINQYGA